VNAITPARTAWRITSLRYATTAFDGEGARRYGGRWNHPGTAMVYTSATLSLSALEYFVHLEPLFAPADLVSVAVEIPAGLAVEFLEIAALPPGWRSYPAPDRLRDLGSGWLRSGRTAVLSVPSSVIPHERNLLFNPAHPEVSRLVAGPLEPFSFDPRMWK
jgi:RES domain-containing protein